MSTEAVAAAPAQEAGHWMARALRLAERGRASTHPNPRVGAVVVREGSLIGEGWHARAGEAHAEIHALRAAGAQARGADLYVTLEPCCHHGRTPPCAEAVIAAGIRRVFVATDDPNPRVAGQGLARLRAAGIEVSAGLLQAEAQRLNRGFESRMRRGRPYLTLKLAASLDGRTAMASGESRWITGAPARRDVQRLRAEAGAVLTGAGTVLADDPQLNWREADIGPGPITPRQPDRIVLDAAARVPASARVWAEGARRFWFTAEAGPAPDGVERIGVARAEAGLDLPAVLAALARREVNEVFAECGPTLAGGLLGSGLVDELLLYLAPSLLGDAARPLAHLPLQQLAERVALRWLDLRRVGDDLRLTLAPDGRARASTSGS